MIELLSGLVLLIAGAELMVSAATPAKMILAVFMAVSGFWNTYDKQLRVRLVPRMTQATGPQRSRRLDRELDTRAR